VIGDLNVFTTAEIMIGQCTDLNFTRPDDPETGFDELSIEKKT
jgi:predicted DNA-binding protein with PD1-like motif